MSLEQIFFYPYAWVYQVDETPYYSMFGVRKDIWFLSSSRPANSLLQDRETLRYAQRRIFVNQFRLWGFFKLWCEMVQVELAIKLAHFGYSLQEPYLFEYITGAKRGGEMIRRGSVRFAGSNASTGICTFCSVRQILRVSNFKW